MDRIKDLHGKAKGTEVEIQGEVAYDSAPKQVRYGQGFNQFLVIQDDPEGGMNGIGCNVPMANVDQGFAKGNSVTIKGKVDKYADRKQPLKPDGTYPVKTSIKVEHIEEFVQAEEFATTDKVTSPVPGEIPDVTASVMSPKDLAEADRPAPKNGYSQAKKEEKEMWAAKDLVVAKQSACKTVGKWIDSGKIQLKDYFKWCAKLVDFFYNTDDSFALITEANLIQSGLITVTKAEAISWIEIHVKGTDVEQDLCGILHVKALDKQTLPELLNTIGKLSLAI